MRPQLNAIGLVVADLAAATSFYQRLGLAFEEAAPGHAETEPAPGFRLMLDTVETVRSYLPGWEPPTGPPKAALAFQFDTAEQVDAKHAELVDAGYHSAHEPWDAFWGQRYATVHDPDGHGVDLYATLTG